MLLKKFPTTHSGCIKAYYKDRFLDGIKVEDMLKENYSQYDFMKWLIQTNDLAYELQENLEAETIKQAKELSLVAPYCFELQLDLFNKQGKHIYREDVTGQSLGKIKEIIHLFKKATASGALTASTGGKDLDGILLKSLKKISHSDFGAFLVSTEKQAQTLKYEEGKAA